jgi:hypothetical protein
LQLLLTVLAVEYGGLIMLRIVCGHRPATDFQTSFAHAGHAHAGVLAVLALLAKSSPRRDLCPTARVLASASSAHDRLRHPPEPRCSGLEHLLERDDPFSASARRGA